MRRVTPHFLIALGVWAAILVSCGGIDSISGTGDSTLKLGMAQFRLSAPPESPFMRLASRAVLCISADDMDTMRTDLTITDSTVEGYVHGIPSGENRRFEVGIYDTDHRLQYTGTAVATVLVGKTVEVTITISRLTGDAVINCIILEDGSGSRQVPTEGLVAHYSLDGDGSDVSGNGLHGKVHGAIPTEDRFGRPGMALNFDGTGDYVEVGDRAELDFGTGSLSFSAWIKTTSALHRRVISKGHFNHDSGYVMAMAHGGTGHMGAGLTAGSGSRSAWLRAGSVYVADGEWHNVTVVWDRTANVGRVYVDNIPSALHHITGSVNPLGETTADISPITGSTSSPYAFFIGAWSGLGQYWEGAIDDVRVYGRALEPSEIEAIHGEGEWAQR